MIACILYEQDRLEEADELLQRYSPLRIHQPSIDMRVLNQIVGTRLRMAHGDVTGALETLDEAIHDVVDGQFDVVRRMLEWERVRIHLITGSTAKALALAELLTSMTEADHSEKRLLYVDEIFGGGIESIRCAIVRGDIDLALAQLDEQIAQANATNRRWRRLKLMLLRVLALEAKGNQGHAQSELAQALCLGYAMNARRSFIDEGQRLQTMLADLPPKALASLPDGESITRYWLGLHSTVSPPSVPNPPASIALSDREHSILTLLATGLANEQIAAQTFLSVNTVKWHIRRILEKLGARNRTEAVFLAKQFKLV
jgi:LuxR family maltose regulon positive regulatory protein